MPELPEIIILARQMRRELIGKTIRAIIEKTKTGSTLRFSRSQSKAQSGSQSAFRPLDCDPAGAIVIY
jgi:formamidopyrimidine-DNA glycosylase